MVAARAAAAAPAPGAINVNMNMPAPLLAHFQATHNFMQQIAASPVFNPPPAAAAPVENQLVLVLKLEVIPRHLHEHMPVTCSWRKKMFFLEPGFWLVVAINKTAPLTRADLVKEMDLPGDFARSFADGLGIHFPTLDQGRKNSLMDHFYSIMNLYLLNLPSVTALMAAMPINVPAVRAVADQLIRDCLPIFKQAREIMIKLDTEDVTRNHGAVSGAMYEAMTTALNGGEHLGDASAMKQVTYHSRIHKPGGRIVTAINDTTAVFKGKSQKCRRCHQQVPAGGFKTHNSTCPGKGVAKARQLDANGKPK